MLRRDGASWRWPASGWAWRRCRCAVALGNVIAGLGRPAADLPDVHVQPIAANPGRRLGRSRPLLVALALLVILALIPLALRMFRANRSLRVGETWGCGRIGQTPRMEYTATAFAEPLRRVFAELYRPTKELSIDFHPEFEILCPVDRI